MRIGLAEVSNLSRRVRQVLTPTSPLNRHLWEGRLSPICFRPFVPADLENCLELYRLNDGGRFPSGYLTQYFKCMAEEQVYSICADGANGLIATGGLAYYMGRSHSAFLCYGLVHPKHHGKGIGTALLLARLALLNPVRSWYCIGIGALESSITFYRRFGFTAFGSWKDMSGAKHPTGALFLLPKQIRGIRSILSEQQIRFPLEDVNSVPFVKQSDSR